MIKRNVIFLSLLLGACTSPYAAGNIPDIPGLTARIVGEDLAEIYMSGDFPKDCEYRRNGVLLKAAYIALANDYDHFEFSSDEDVSKLNYKSIKLSSDAPIPVYLCRGTCPLMYSADSVSHMLVSKFSRGTWTAPATSRRESACHLSSR